MLKKVLEPLVLNSAESFTKSAVEAAALILSKSFWSGTKPFLLNALGGIQLCVDENDVQRANHVLKEFITE